MRSKRLISLLTVFGFVAVSPALAAAQGVAVDVDEALADIDKAAAQLEALDVAPVSVYKASYDCSGQQNLIIDGKKFAEGNKIGGKKIATVINAHGHCNLILRNLEITGIVAINAHGHANVLVQNSVIQGKVAVDAHGHANVTVRNSTVRGKQYGVKMGGHANVHVGKKSKVNGRIKKSRFSHYVKVK